jgi:hypothetical protein
MLGIKSTPGTRRLAAVTFPNVTPATAAGSAPGSSANRESASSVSRLRNLHLCNEARRSQHANRLVLSFTLSTRPSRKQNLARDPE